MRLSTLMLVRTFPDEVGTGDEVTSALRNLPYFVPDERVEGRPILDLI